MMGVAALVDESVEEALLFGILGRSIFWMPLHADQPMSVEVFDRFDDSVRAVTSHVQAIADSINGLMMK